MLCCSTGTGSPKKGGGQFYVSHRPELLDVPGEFWHDVDNNAIYLVVAGAGDKDGHSSSHANGAGRSPPPLSPPSYLVVPQVSEVFKVTGSQAAPVTNVRFTSMTLQHVAPTYMRKTTVPSGGDYAVFRGAAVHLNGTVNCSVDNNLFDRIGGNVSSESDLMEHKFVFFSLFFSYLSSFLLSSFINFLAFPPRSCCSFYTLAHTGTRTEGGLAD